MLASSRSSLGEIEALFDARQARIKAVKTNGLLGELNLNMRKIRFEMPDPHSQIVEPRFHAIHRGADMAQVLKNDIVRVFAHWFSFDRQTILVNLAPATSCSNFLNPPQIRERLK